MIIYYVRILIDLCLYVCIITFIQYQIAAIVSAMNLGCACEYEAARANYILQNDLITIGGILILSCDGLVELFSKGLVHYAASVAVDDRELTLFDIVRTTHFGLIDDQSFGLD